MTLIHTARSNELLEMSKGLYLSIVGLTETPAEFVMIIGMLHLMIWMKEGEDDADVDVMLDEYCKTFKENLKANEDLRNREMN